MAQLHFAETFWPADFSHGNYALDEAFAIEKTAAQRLRPGASPRDFQDALYFDIEPRGLHGPNDRFAFLVGIGAFEAFNFRLRQYFLADLQDEKAMLEAVAELFDRKKLMVTFNGRRFDVPRLESRYTLNGLVSWAASMPHVDLLDAVRRLYGTRLDSCRLSSVESSLLKVDRDAGHAGSAPALFADGRRWNAGLSLDALFQHNAFDVLSLVTLVAHIGKEVSGNAGNEARHLLALAKWDQDNGDLASAEDLYRRAWMADRTGDAGGHAALGLAGIYRREGRAEDLQALWGGESQAATEGRRARAFVELAKLAERRHEYEPARSLSLAATNLLEALPRHRRPLHPTLGEIEVRSKRLARRLVAKRRRVKTETVDVLC